VNGVASDDVEDPGEFVVRRLESSSTSRSVEEEILDLWKTEMSISASILDHGDLERKKGSGSRQKRTHDDGRPLIPSSRLGFLRLSRLRSDEDSVRVVSSAKAEGTCQKQREGRRDQGGKETRLTSKRNSTPSSL